MPVGQRTAAAARAKIALFCNVEERAVVSIVNAQTIYQVPAMLHEQGVDDLVVERFGLACASADLSSWEEVVEAELHPEREVRIAIVGKYLDLIDAYKSLSEAVNHAGIQHPRPALHRLHRCRESGARRHRAAQKGGRHPRAGRLRAARL